MEFDVQHIEARVATKTKCIRMETRTEIVKRRQNGSYIISESESQALPIALRAVVAE